VVVAVAAGDVLDVGDAAGDGGRRADVDAVGQGDVDAGSAVPAGQIDVLRVVERVCAAESVDAAGEAAGRADLEERVAVAAPPVLDAIERRMTVGGWVAAQQRGQGAPVGGGDNPGVDVVGRVERVAAAAAAVDGHGGGGREFREGDVVAGEGDDDAADDGG